MLLANKYSMKCKECGRLFSRDFSLDKHIEKDNCDGPLCLWCGTCNAYAPETGCEACEEKAREAEEKKQKQEARLREIEAKKRIIQQRIKEAKKSALSAVIKKKCRSDGGIYAADYTDEEHHDREMCDGPLDFYCEICSSFQAGPICGACEQHALDARKRAEERERLRKERERLERLERERQEKRQRAFQRAVMIPTYAVLVLPLLCMALMTQLFIFGEFVMPYTIQVLIILIFSAIVAAVSIPVIGLFFDDTVGN